MEQDPVEGELRVDFLFEFGSLVHTASKEKVPIDTFWSLEQLIVEDNVVADCHHREAFSYFMAPSEVCWQQYLFLVRTMSCFDVESLEFYAVED